MEKTHTQGKRGENTHTREAWRTLLFLFHVHVIIKTKENFPAVRTCNCRAPPVKQELVVELPSVEFDLFIANADTKWWSRDTVYEAVGREL